MPRGLSELLQWNVGEQVPVLRRYLVSHHAGDGTVDALAAILLEPPAVARAHKSGAPVNDLTTRMGTDVGKQLIAALALHKEERPVSQVNYCREFSELRFRAKVLHVTRSLDGIW